MIENSTEETINNRKCGIGLKLHLLIILLNIQKKALNVKVESEDLGEKMIEKKKQMTA